MLHATHQHDFGYSMWDYFPEMNHWPLFLFSTQDTTHYSDTGFAMRGAARFQSGYKDNLPDGFIGDDYDRQYASGGTGTNGHKTFAELVSDGSWHKVTIELKGNSGINVEDGWMKISIDDVAIVDREDLAWSDSPKNASYSTALTPQSFVGWNFFTIGGNMYNRLDATTVKREFWYAIDDIVVTSVGGGTSATIGAGTTTNIGSGTTVNIQ